MKSISAPQINSLDDSLNFFDQTELEGLSSQEREWAQQQYRQIYAVQMAKITMQLEHQKKIQQNLQTIEQKNTQITEQNYLKLKEKLQKHDQKRQQKAAQKLKNYKLQEQKWHNKIRSIESKFRRQNQEAVEKAQKYRQQSQQFWHRKQSTQPTPRETSYQQKFRQESLNNTQKDLSIKDYRHKKFDLPNFHSNNGSKSRQKIGDARKLNKYMRFKVDTMGRLQNIIGSGTQLDDGLYSSRRDLFGKQSRTIDIDGEIVKHKEKSQQLKREKQSLIFQNAMKRLAKIQLTRKKAQKSRQSAKSPVQIRKPNRRHPMVNDEENFYKGSPDYSRSLAHGASTKSKESLIDHSIQTHVEIKRALEQKAFRQRDKILENQYKRKRKDKILKLIKNKVKDLKRVN